MYGIESLLRLATVVLSTSFSPAAGPVTAVEFDSFGSVASLTVATIGSAGDLQRTVRWQEQDDEVPPEPLDDIPRIVQVDPLDIDPLGEEPLDAEILDADLPEEEAVDIEPLDAPLDEDEVAAIEPLDAPIVVEPEPEVVAAAPPAKPAPEPAVVDSKRKPVLPPNFGVGETIVHNPTAGNTAPVPTDCKVLVENGRMVVGSGCGGAQADSGFRWADEVASLPAPAPLPSRAETQPAATSSRERVRVSRPSTVTRDSTVRETIGHSTITVGDREFRVPNVRNVRTIEIRRDGGTAIERQQSGSGNRTKRATELRSFQTAKDGKTKNKQKNNQNKSQSNNKKNKKQPNKSQKQQNCKQAKKNQKNANKQPKKCKQNQKKNQKRSQSDARSEVSAVIAQRLADAGIGYNARVRKGR